MAPTTTTRSPRRLRGPSHQSSRALDHETPSAPFTNLFDTEEEAASRDHVGGDDHREDFDDGAFDPANQDQAFKDPYHGHGGKDQPPGAPKRPLEQPQPLPQDSDSASWDTRAQILLAEVVTVTLIVATVLFLCLRRHRKRLDRLAQQRVVTMAQMQEWTTIRIPAAGTNGRDVMVAAPSPRAAAALSTGVREGRIRQESGMSEMLSEVLSGVGRPQGRAPSSDHNNENEDQENSPRTPLARLRAVPRTIGNIILYPLRALEAGVNGWATENYDEAFLRQFMERLEAEREAARENPEERELRLKEAFEKQFMVWELDDENFKPPKFDDEDYKENLKPSSSPLYSFGGTDQQDLQEVLQDYGLDLAEMNQDQVLKNAEEGKIEGELAALYCVGEKDQEARPDAVSPLHDQDDSAVACCDTLPSSEDPQVAKASPASATTTRTRASTADQLRIQDASSIDSMDDNPTSPSSLLVGGTSAGDLHSVAPPAEDTFDEDAAPGYLYLSSSSHNRRRANTGESIGTNASSSGRSTRTLSSGESSGSLASSTAASSTSQDSHKIPNECAICLMEYEVGDTIITSCNPDCPHAFHQECIVEWLVKMQDGTPCPCCRRTFVELDGHGPGGARGDANASTVAAPRNNTNNNAGARGDGNNATTAGAATTNNDSNANANENSEEQQQDPEEAERLRRQRRREHIELGIRRGGRAFNTSVISLSGQSANNNETEQDRAERRRVREERMRSNIQLGLRRGGRAFNTSIISLR